LIELRGGANDLEIDRGRREKKEVKARICGECKGAVEDEIHFLLECPVYFYTRKEMFQCLEWYGVMVEEGEAREITWKKVMSCKYKGQWTTVGKYAAKMLAQRKEAERRREAREEGE